MRLLFRRLAWLVARLLFLCMVSFAILRLPDGSLRSTEPWRSASQPDPSLPRFVNPSPRDLRARCDALVDRLKSGPDPGASRELVRLGAASFPLVLPEMSSLPPPAQKRLARALLDVVQRMGLDPGPRLEDGESAPRYLQRTWKERAVDFDPRVVRRWVERLADQSLLARRSEVAQLDTFALNEIIAALPEVQTSSDARRAQRLVELASHCTGLDWMIEPSMSVPQARDVVERWKRWWLLHRADYTVLDGPARLSAILTETQFGKWMAMALAHQMGVDGRGRAVAPQVGAAALVTLPLVMAAFLGSWLVLFVLAGVRNQRVARPGIRRWVVTALGAVPPVAYAAWASSACTPSTRAVLGAITAGVVVALGALATAMRTFGNFARLSTDSEFPPRARVKWRDLLRTIATLTDSDWPWVLTTAFVVERAFLLPGIGMLSVNAIKSGDWYSLMAVALVSALFLLLLELILSPWPSSRHTTPRFEGAFQ